MHDVGGWSDGVGTQEKAFATFLSCGNQSPRCSLVACDRGIGTLGQFVGFLHIHRLDIQREVLSVVEAVGEYLYVRCD